jgi:hypothetical protein
MFTIEFVIAEGRESPAIIEKMVSRARYISDANIMARSQLEGVRRNHPEAPPDGFQIRDASGHIVLRSWQTSRLG